jgi:hypothetical protein
MKSLRWLVGALVTNVLVMPMVVLISLLSVALAKVSGRPLDALAWQPWVRLADTLLDRAHRICERHV